MERIVSLKFLVLWAYFLGCFVELAHLYRKAIEPKQCKILAYLLLLLLLKIFCLSVISVCEFYNGFEMPYAMHCV